METWKSWFGRCCSQIPAVYSIGSMLIFLDVPVGESSNTWNIYMRWRHLAYFTSREQTSLTNMESKTHPRNDKGSVFFCNSLIMLIVYVVFVQIRWSIHVCLCCLIMVLYRDLICFSPLLLLRTCFIRTEPRQQALKKKTREGVDRKSVV